MAVLGFWAIGIDDLAETLSRSLGIRLYHHSSPMIGTWYSDTDLGTLIQQLKEGKKPDPTQHSGMFELVLNDPEPGYRRPEFPGKSECLLRVEADVKERIEIEEKLRQSGLHFEVLRE